MTARPAWLVAILAAVVACGSPPPSPTTVVLPSSTAEPVASSVAADPSTTDGIDQAAAFAAVPCPDAVTIVMVVTPSCGVLTVEQRRADPAGPEIRVFVVRIDPPSLEQPDPMVVVGTSLGARMAHGEVVQVARRTGRVTFLVDQRGSGLSEPALDCPGLVRLQHEVIGRASLDPAAIDRLAEAARECRGALIGQGIDPTAFDLAESALDIRDLRSVLGIDTWNVIAFGTASRLALEVAHADPDGVRTLVLDSPVTSGTDDPVAGIAATGHALDELTAACAADVDCAAALPDLEASLAAAIASLDADPMSVPAGAQGPAAVIDGGRFARAVRAVLGLQGGLRIASITSALDSIEQGAFGPDHPIVDEIQASTELCFGRLPDCPRLEIGLVLTMACRDVLPFVGPPPEPGTAAGLGRAFVLDDWTAVCDAWSVPAADREAGLGARGLPDKPVLLLNGQFDPFTGPLDRAVLRPAPGMGLALEVPNQSYNAFGYNECPRQVRRAWLDDPTTRALDLGCFDAEIAPIQVWSPPSSS